MESIDACGRLRYNKGTKFFRQMRLNLLREIRGKVCDVLCRYVSHLHVSREDVHGSCPQPPGLVLIKYVIGIPVRADFLFS